MKIIPIVVGGMLAIPLVLCILGIFLGWLFNCTGFDYISKCSVPAVTGLVSGLVSMGWLILFAIPLAPIVAAVMFLGSRLFDFDKSVEPGKMMQGKSAVGAVDELLVAFREQGEVLERSCPDCGERISVHAKTNPRQIQLRCRCGACNGAYTFAPQ